MSNSVNPNANNGHCNTLGTRDGTRVVLREITATLQNSSPMQPGLRKVANNTQTGKTEHEVKVQFTREFVDAGAPNSRPESLSSAGSFQSLASTLSNKSSPVPSTLAVTSLKAADTSYVNSDIPGLEELITACGNIHLGDRIDAEESEAYNTLVDNALTITTTENFVQSPNTLQNSSHEEAFTSAINDLTQLNGTQDLSSDYKEAHDTSNSLNDTKESVPDPKLEELDSESTKDLSCEEITANLTTNYVKHSLDIPQSFVDNSAPEEVKDSSLKSDFGDAVNLNVTVDIAPIPEQLDINSLEVQDYSPNSNLSKIPQLLNETNELIANCNSIINDLEFSKIEVPNLTHNISSVDNDQPIDVKSQSTAAEATANLSNDLSVTEADKDISTLNVPLNLPPKLDVLHVNQNTSTPSLQSLDIPNGAVTETPSTLEEPPKKESDSFIETHVSESIKDFAKEETIVPTSQVISEGCEVDLSTGNFTNVKSLNTNQTEIPILSTTFKEIPQNKSAEFSLEATVQEQFQQLPNNHDASTVVPVLEIESKVVEDFEPPSSIQFQETAQPILQEIPNQKNSQLEFEDLKQLPTETSNSESQINQIKGENLGATLSANKIIVPYDSQDSLKCLQELEESKSEKLPQVVFDVTPFPGSNSEIERESTLNLKEDSLHEGSSTDQDSNQTVIIREESFHSVSSDGANENYQAFLPQQQSTSLQSDCNFKKLEQAAQVIAEEIRTKSLELTEDSDQFFNADSELFVDPVSFDFFLSKSNCKNTVVRDLRAESLYVQFDPLVSNANMLPQGPPQVVDGEENTKASIPQPTLDTPRRNPAVAAIDRLLIYSPAAGTPHKFEAPPKIEEKIVKEVEPEIVPVIDETMAKELELVRSTVLQLESEIGKERKELEKQRLSYKKLEEELAQEVQKKNEMTLVMDEYEKSLSRQMTDRERERASFAQERARLQEELQTANHHLGNTEAAFNDVHSKYERMKSVVSAYKSNEDVLKESVQENVETIKTLEARYEQLKNHAMSQLEKANLELEAIRKQHETETVRLQAMIRKAELKSNSLAEMVEQKSKENKELAAILDEVIARVGQNPE